MIDALRPLLLLAALLALPAAAQQGDRAGEKQPDLPSSLEVPAAPVLSPQAGLASITVQPGFRVELVAAEPLIEDPVAISFDEHGRIWVVEMRGYMPNVNGTEEDAPVGRIVILEDADGDGRMDESTVFLDELVLPRALGLAFGGALVAAPPNLLFCRDTDGDGRADEKRVVWSGFGGIDSPEHAGNGLLYGLDNWIACSQHGVRFRFDGTEIVTEPVPGHGQWGITQDDFGRFYYTPNSHPLRGDLFSKHYASRNPNQRNISGMFEQVSNDFRVWPVRITPGVNRGYRKGVLTDEYKLNRMTGGCGPAIYRGDLFPDEFRGDAFICEPAGNLVKHNRMTETSRGPIARAHYDQADFLASTDERFRPVNACIGPDGALYIVDMYRGILQHRVFMTTFLRKQVIARGLDAPIGLGRIYRIVPDGAPAPRRATPGDATDTDLVGMLEHPNGWHRDTAQRLLVERRATHLTDPIRRLARESTTFQGRLHALWTLEGLDAVGADDVRHALADEHWAVRMSAIRLAEPRFDAVADARILSDESLDVRTQAALSLGVGDPRRSLETLAQLIDAEPAERRILSAAVSSVRDLEPDLLDTLLQFDDWRYRSTTRERVVVELADTALRSRNPDVRARLLDVALDRRTEAPWQSRLLLRRIANAQRLDSDAPRPLEIAEPSPEWESIAAGGTWDLSPLAARVDSHLAWPGRPARAPGPRPLTRSERTLFERGRALYANCTTCHRSRGEGMTGLYPPLANSEWVLGDPATLGRILLHGIEGPITVGDVEYEGTMPAAPWTDDEAVAAVMTYIRRSWGNTADPVTPNFISDLRKESRSTPWTAVELESSELKAQSSDSD